VDILTDELDLKVYPKTVYTDIVNMPDPMLLGLTVHYYNFSDITLYMKLLISGPSPWSSNAQELGSLGSGLNAYINIDNFTSRSKPSNATTEVLTVTLEAYNDSGYSNLMYTFSRSLTVVFIKSDDGTWTISDENNFDNGTVQGWAVVNEGTYHNVGYPTIDVATDYVLSTPYSCKMTQLYSYDGYNQDRGPVRARLYKSFTTPNKTNIYAILNVRFSSTFSGSVWAYNKNLIFKKDTDTLVFLGKPYDTVHSHYISKDKWIRVVIPLPSNSTFEIRISHEYLCSNITSGMQYYYGYLWLDDFKIISK